MKGRTVVIIIFILLIGEWIGAYFYFNKKNKEIEHHPDTIEIIKYKTKRDSLLQLINDTSIVIIEHTYEKNVNNLLSQPIDSQCSFFSNYLSKNSGRLLDCNNSDSIKTN